MSRIPHPSGATILHENKWHQYKFGTHVLRSVSKLLDKHFPFNEKRALELVAKKTGQTTEEVKESWSRQALLGKNIHEYIENKLAGKPPPTWMLVLKQKQKLKDAAAGKGGVTEAGNSQESEDSSSPKSSTSRSIVDSILHGEEEAYVAVADAAVEQMLKYYHVIAVEQVVASPTWGIAGTVDVVALNKRTGKLFIGDWKTSGSVASNFRFSIFETPCIGCLSHLPNSKFHRYAMQVAVYGEIMRHEHYLDAGFFGRSVKPIDKRVEEIRLGANVPSDAIEYGIVQLQKDESGSVVADFKAVTESTVLPVDSREINFQRLLQDLLES
ncbi:hypothetical protein TRVL_06388 [Trypanosoma vivax]|nr:hypothetical protein TRVL_06388 [Trypanosoma vivax]